MTDASEHREATRTDHYTPLQVKDLQSNKVYEARMFNYSSTGLYFESDGVFGRGRSIYIGIQNSPYSNTSRVFEYYKGEVVWSQELKRSLFRYGYGVQFTIASKKPGSKTNNAKSFEDMRKHPRKSFYQTIRLDTRSGIAKGTTKNISASGVFISADTKLEVGQTLDLSFPLKNGKTIKNSGEIIWTSDDGFGIKFKK